MYYQEQIASVLYDKKEALNRATNCLSLLVNTEKENKTQFIKEHFIKKKQYSKYFPKFIIDIFFASSEETYRHMLENKKMGIETQIAYNQNKPFCWTDYFSICEKIINACNDESTINIYLTIDDLHMFDEIERTLGHKKV